MSFQIVRNDITRIHADAIVNTANPNPVIGSGTDAAIHTAAGPELLEARRRIGKIAPGEARITGGFRLPARFVIHTVGPVWIDGAHGECDVLRRCYDHSLELAAENGCRSLAFPLISAGNDGFPGEIALEIATDSIRRFLEHSELSVTLAVFDRKSYRLSEALLADVRSFIDETYVAEQKRMQDRMELRSCRNRDAEEDFVAEAMRMQPAMLSPGGLDELLAHRDAGFAETLVSLIEQSGKKNSEIYKKANVDKKLFSKIINNVNYHPSKPTAVAFAVALELSWEQAKDLVERAGYSMTHSSRFDIIIEYFLKNHIYDLFEINETLFAFDQSLLGC